MKKFKASGLAINMAFTLFAFLLPIHPNGSLYPRTKSATTESMRKPVPDAFDCDAPAPGTCSAEMTGTSTAFVEWSPVTRAVSYRLMVYDVNNQTLIANTIEYGTSKNLTGLSAGVKYRCVVASMCSSLSTSSFIIAEDILD